MFGPIARAVAARPLVVVLGWILVAGAIIAFAPKISDITSSDQAAFLPRTTESARAAEQATRAFPESQGATAVIVVRRADRAGLGEGDLGAVEQLALRLNAARVGAVRGVQFDRQSISPRGDLALLRVGFTAAPEDETVRDAVRGLRRESAAALTGSGLVAGLTGQAAAAVDNGQAVADAERVVTLVTLGLILLLLLAVFRSPVAALLPLLAVGLVYGVSSALVAAAGTAFDFEIGREVPTMLTVVLFGIGTDYVLFVLFRYRERLRAGDEPRAAITGAVERVGEAIFSAASAVIAAFGALVLAAAGFFRTLGPALAIGVFVMLFAALTLVPAVVSLLGRLVFWPARSAPRAVERGGFAWLGRLVARRPVVVVAGTVTLLAGLSTMAFLFVPAYDPIGQLPARTEAARAYQDLKSGFPAGALAPTEVLVTRSTPLSEAEVGTFVRYLSGLDGVASPLAPRVSADGRVAAVPVLLVAEPYSNAALDFVSGPLRDAARAGAPAGAEVLVGGQTMAFADIRDITQRDLAVVLPVAAVLFLLILAGLLRAILAPGYLVVMVVAGFAATLGSAVALFQLSLGRAGLAFSIPIILYLFVTAIGTDYNILVTARLREELRDGRTPRDAAALAIARAGPSVAAAALILAGTFGSLVLTGVPFFVEIGFAVTLGILVAAFVISLLLVPAATALVGRAAWWPGRRRPPEGVLPVTSTASGTRQGAP
jgi:putative drug exporter of the RND superfamily